MVDGSWKSVVCHRAGEGQVNVWELAEGTPLQLQGALTLVFSPRHARGRRGSDVDVRETLAGLRWPARSAYLQRIAASRNDHDACAVVLEFGGRSEVESIARRARGVMDGAVREVHEKNELNTRGIEGAIPYLTSVDLLEEIGKNGGRNLSGGRLLGMLVARMYELGAQDRARVFVDLAADAIAVQRSWQASREWGVLEHLPSDELRRVLLELEIRSSDRGLLLQDAVVCLVEQRSRRSSREDHTALLDVLGGMAARCSHDGWSMEAELARAAELAEESRGHGAVFNTYGFSHRWMVPELADENAIVSRALATPCSFVMKPEEYEGWWLRSELVRMQSAQLEQVRDAATEWVLAGAEIGVPQEVCCAMWQWRVRRDVVSSPRMQNKEFLRDVALQDPKEQVVRAALVKLDDDELWLEKLRARRSWVYAEKAPARVLREVVSTDGERAWAEPRNAMVLLRRGVIGPDVTLLHPDDGVRLVSVRMTRDEALLRQAAEDSFMDVALEAGTKSLNAETVKLVLQRYEGFQTEADGFTSHERTVWQCKQRLMELERVELVRTSLRRGDLVTARGAMSLITDRSLLWSLSDEAELQPWLGSALQRTSTIEPF
jgi:hypothetical protein